MSLAGSLDVIAQGSLPYGLRFEVLCSLRASAGAGATMNRPLFLRKKRTGHGRRQRRTKAVGTDLRVAEHRPGVRVRGGGWW